MRLYERCSAVSFSLLKGEGETRSLGHTDLEGHGELHDVKVHVVQLQGLQGGLQGGPHQLWGVACGPQLEEEEETGGRGTVRQTPGNVRE